MAKKTKPKRKPPNIRFYIAQLSGAEIERRKAQRVCLFCLTALTYRFDGDAKTGCLQDFCVHCRITLDATAPPAARARVDVQAERRAGLDNLARLLGEN